MKKSTLTIKFRAGRYNVYSPDGRPLYSFSKKEEAQETVDKKTSVAQKLSALGWTSCVMALPRPGHRVQIAGSVECGSRWHAVYGYGYWLDDLLPLKGSEPWMCTWAGPENERASILAWREIPDIRPAYKGS